MCSTPETIRSLSFTGEFNGPNQLPPGPITDDIITRYIGVTQRLRQQLIVDFGCARSGSNIVPDLIDLEVAHWLKLQMMLEGLPGQNPNPQDPPPPGPVSEGEINRDGTKSRVKWAVADVKPGDLLGDDGWAATPYGRRWYSLWIALPPEIASSAYAGGPRGVLPIASQYFGGWS